MTLRETLAAYCRSIRNKAKREYALAYVADQLASDGGGHAIDYRCGVMAAQAVRLRVAEIFRHAGH
jgi:hypothetical protein